MDSPQICRFENTAVMDFLPLPDNTGRMATMRTVAPQVFVDFKRWMAEAAPQRDAAKRRRDRLQADIVQALLDQQLLVT